MIKSFSDTLTRKVFLRELLTKKERKSLGSLNLKKAVERLALLDVSNEKNLLLSPALHYHHLKGTTRYSIDADSRKSPWRITFCWEDEEMTHVELVTIEDTH